MWKTKCRRQGKVGRGNDDGAKIGMGTGRAAMLLTPGMRFPMKLLPILAGVRRVRTGVFGVQMGKWGMWFLQHSGLFRSFLLGAISAHFNPLLSRAAFSSGHTAVCETSCSISLFQISFCR